MKRRSKLMLAVGVAGTVALAIAAPASASDTYVGKVKSYSNDNVATYSVQFGSKFASVDQVCATFGFADTDPFGPGDELLLELTPVTGFGFFAPEGSAEVTSRTICAILYPGEADYLTPIFGDGKQKI